MRVLSKATLRDFWEQPSKADSEQPLKAWHDECRSAKWQTPQDIKHLYGSASFVANNRVVFNIHGNKYRLIAQIKYESSLVFIRFIGTHAEYDKIDAATI